MKKIIFYKAMRNGQFEPSQGYYYKAQNGSEFAIHGNSGDWGATELTTGMYCGIYGKTIEDACKQVEQRANSFVYAITHIDCSKYINQIAQLRATGAQGA